MSDTPRTDSQPPWHGEPAVSIDFARELEREVAALKIDAERMREALERISHAKPDQLDHALDVAIIQRAANIARAALSAAKGKA